LSALALFAVVAVVLTGCKPTAELEPCNVAHSECQLDIFYALLRLRGDGADPFVGVPPIRTLTVEEYELELRGGKPAPPEPPPEPPAEPPPEEEEPPKEVEVDPWDVTLQLLGLIEPKVPSGEQGVANKKKHVAAYYSSDTRTVTVIDRDYGRNDFWDTALLTHELVHALQDDELSGWDPDSTDALNVRRSMIEGEASLYEDLTILGMRGRERTDKEWRDLYERRIEDQRGGLPYESSVYLAAEWLVYPLGANRLIDAFLDGGNAGIRHVLGDPPRSSAELILFDTGKKTGPRAGLSCEVELPGPDFARVVHDELGALHVYGFLAKAGLDIDDAWKRASHLTDDRLAVYFDREAKAVAASWRQRFGDEDDAQRIVDALAGAEHTFTVEADHGDLLVRVSNREGLLDDWPGANKCNR
jgi:hypothetical protein